MPRPKRIHLVWDHSRVSQLLADVLSRGAASIAGLFLVIATTTSLMRTVVIPRALRSGISDTVSKAVIGVGMLVSRMRRAYGKRDSVLAAVGPSIIILQLLTWLILYLVAYGLLIYGVSGRGLGEALRQSGSSLLTLGFASGDRSEQTIVDFVAAATGPIVIALLIGFLPTIYSVYLERELDVTMLNASGGEPAWGPEILARAHVANDLETLQTDFIEWASWAVRLRLTHVTYPVLMWVRSSRPSRHYIAALIAVLDAAALQLSLSPSIRPNPAFGTLLQGSQTIQVLYVFLFRKRGWSTPRLFAGRNLGVAADTTDETDALTTHSQGRLIAQMAASLDTGHDLDSDMMKELARGERQPLTITREDFDHAVDMLERVGFPIQAGRDEAWHKFSVYRSGYEFAGLAIARRLDATPSPWSGSRRVPTPTWWPTLVVDLMPDTKDDAA
jgi:hypothetical protein